MKKAIYSALLGRYDMWKEPQYVNNDYDYYLFTDQPVKSDIYKVIPTTGGVAEARDIKIRPHIHLPGYDFYVWHDASLAQKRDINHLATNKQFDMMICTHHLRDCIYDEFNQCVKQGKCNYDKMKKQIDSYRSQKYPENNGLVASGVIIRYNTYKINLFCEYWFNEIKNGSTRDQLSFNYILWKYPNLLDVKNMPFEIMRTHFKFRKHNNNGQK